jgi:colicin import membrane protein
MAGRLKQYFINTKALVYAIAIHVAVVALLFVSFDWGPTSFKSNAATPQVEPVKAKMISEADVKKQMELLKAKEQKKNQQELQAKKRLADLLKQQEQEKKRLADLKSKKQQEEKKAKSLAKKRKLEEQRVAKAKQEKQRKQREAKKRKAEQKRRAELAQKEERERQARVEAERKAQLKAKLEAEAETQRMAQAVNAARSRYIPIIQQKVDRNWTRPSGLKGLNAGVRVRLTPNGEVISAKVVRSSGNPVFDRSVENAVLKASPLPIPRERGVNDKFRDIQFNFDPDEKLISLR